MFQGHSWYLWESDLLCVKRWLGKLSFQLMSQLLPAYLTEGLEVLNGLPARNLPRCRYKNPCCPGVPSISLQPFNKPQVLHLRASISRGLPFCPAAAANPCDACHSGSLPFWVLQLLYFHFLSLSSSPLSPLLPESKDVTSPERPFWDLLIEPA